MKISNKNNDKHSKRWNICIRQRWIPTNWIACAKVSKKDQKI